MYSIFLALSFRHCEKKILASGLPGHSVKPPPKKKKKFKRISEGIEPAHSLSYQRLPDANPQHHPTHSLKVHHNMEPLQWGVRMRGRVRYSREEGGKGRKRCIA